MTKKEIINLIVKILQIAVVRQLFIREICNKRWCRELLTLPISSLLRKLRFVISNCSLRTIREIYRRGLVNRKDVLCIVGENVYQRNLQDAFIVADLMRQYHAHRDFENMFLDREGDELLLMCDQPRPRVATDEIQNPQPSTSFERENEVHDEPQPSTSGMSLPIVDEMFESQPTVFSDIHSANGPDHCIRENETNIESHVEPQPSTSQILNPQPSTSNANLDNVDSDSSYSSHTSSSSSSSSSSCTSCNSRRSSVSSSSADHLNDENLLQNGRGMEVEEEEDIFHGNDFITIENENFRHYRRFQMDGRELQCRVRDPPDNVNVFTWLEQAFRQLHERITANYAPTDMIGVTIHTGSLSQGPVWLSFRPVNDFSANELWEIFFNAAQSSGEFEVDNSFSINVTTVRMPVGSGRVKLTAETVNKRSILTIKNNDNLCLPRSLVAAHIFVLRGQIRTGELHTRWEKIRKKDGKFQKETALNLIRLSKVRIPATGCGLKEIRDFQNYYAEQNVAIVVYSFQNFGRGDKPLFDGVKFLNETGIDISHVLRIMYYEMNNHYQPILNLLAASGSRGYCIPCNKSFKNEVNHRCSNKCFSCLQKPPCDSTLPTIKCNFCFRNFYGNACYKNHQKRSSFAKKKAVCENLSICQRCCKNVRSTSSEPHVCDICFCNVCKEKLPVNHLCYIKPLKPRKNDVKVVFLFYDFETQQCNTIEGDQTVKVHVPNLCVVHQVCTYCLKDSDVSKKCNKCGVREYIFKIEPVKEFIDLALARRRHFKQTICIAHNAKGFDAQFVFKQLVERGDQRDKPTVILNGSKIILMEIGKVKFIDSLNYFQMPLSSLPKAFGFGNFQKGTFPHLFNLPENQNYVGPMPPLETYSPDTMSQKERNEFLTWYNEEIRQEKIFNFENEIVKYCKQDVTILRLACLAFRETFINCGDVDPFEESATIASSCLKVFRRKYLAANTIGVIPTSGYRLAQQHSLKACRWLFWMEKILDRRIEYSFRCRERKLPEGPQVDGYCEARSNEKFRAIVLQFHGCFWHGCRQCFEINRDVNLSSGETLESRFERTKAISEKIKNNNYKLIEIWECQFDKQLIENEDMKNYLMNENFDKNIKEPLNPRDAFYGGRTGNTVKVYDAQRDEKIKYVDVCSLYPFICKTGKYPIGHPKLFIGEEECLSIIGTNNESLCRINGLIMCKVLPPRNLYHPVLPVKMHGKLLFPLCRSCCEDMIQEDCPHDDPEQRHFTGTWVSEEVKKAVQMGYTILNTYEIWQYEITQYNYMEKTGGIFTGYIDEFFKQKTEASGYPDNCTSTEEQDLYIQELEQVEGIRLNKERICSNPGLRSVAKMCLNSLWGKFGQRENMKKTDIVTTPQKLVELLSSPEIEVCGILPVNDEIIYVNWCYKSEALTPSPTTNVVVAAFTTAQARLKLYEYLDMLGERVLYYDTDSVIYRCSEGQQEPLIGSMLGQLTDELTRYGTGSFISSFISGGPKFYAYKVMKPDRTFTFECKVKGIKLNYVNSEKINYETVRKLIELNSTIELNFTSIKRTNFHDVVTVNDKKSCKSVYSKRRFSALDKSYPYGYKEM